MTGPRGPGPTEPGESTEPIGRPTPLSYEPGAAVGIGLDLDGTAYRFGSVSVETIAYLSYTSEMKLTERDRAHLRSALSTVARYGESRPNALRWAVTMRVLDGFQAVGAASLSRRLLARIIDRHTGRVRDAGGDRTGDPVRGSSRTITSMGSTSYRTMRRRLLTAYGAFLRGKRATEVERIVEGIVTSRTPVDPRLRTILDRARTESGAETFLVSDAPEHIARAYARKLTGEPDRVRATAFETDASGRFTGAFESIDKRRALTRLRAEREWEYVVAAGDSAVDARMAAVSNLFVAVRGQGDIGSRDDDLDPVSPRSVGRLREELCRDRNVIGVGPDEELWRALLTALRAVGVLS